jgi:phosphatidylglycerol:prolipoprotein diacylglycerol transferase
VHPRLFDLGGWSVSSYELALVLAFVLGIAIGVVRARRHGLAVEPVLGVSIVVIVSSILGSRLFFALNPPVPTGAGVAEALNPFASGPRFGLSVMGGLPAALVCAWLFLRLRGLPVLAYMDLLAPSVAFGAGVTRIGCFFNGCCHGVACSWPWAVRFPPGSLPWQHLGDVAVHPTQLYQSLLGFAIGAFLLWVARRKPPAGTVLSALICLWGLQRLGVESLRFHQGDEIWFEFGTTPVSVYQGVALGLAVVGAAGWAVATRRAKQRAT